MAEKLVAQTEQETIKAQWQEFAKTLAYQKFIEYIETQKEMYSIMAAGPFEVFKQVTTLSGEKATEFEFEPEKYAYLLQRGVGCDIVKIYVEENVSA